MLVVDDDPAIETFFASRLGKYGVDTLYAPDAVHGYRVAAREKPSVIICDNFMPDGDAQFLLYQAARHAGDRGHPAFRDQRPQAR